jgi:hypothetical protein
VPNFREGDSETDGGEIENKTLEDVSKEPETLPAGFVWCTVDLKDDE